MTGIFLSFFEISVSMSVLIAAVLLLAPFGKRYAAKWKYLLWIFLALRLVVPVSGQSLQSVFSALTAGKTQRGSDAESAGSQPISGEKLTKPQAALMSGQTKAPADGARRAQSAPVTIEIPAQMTTEIALQSKKTGVTPLDVVAIVWLAGSLMFLSLHIVSYLHYRKRVLRLGYAVEDDGILRQIAELKGELHIARAVPAIICPEAGSPMILGFFRPVLILPEMGYREEDLMFILKHELVHVKRGDMFYKLLFVAANAVHWFNPLIYVMQREAGVDMELSCDERVLLGTDYAMRKAYTETLFAMIHKQGSRRTVLSTQFYGGKQIMKKRFQNILTKNRRKNGAVVVACVVVLSIGIGTLVGCSVAQSEPLSAKLNQFEIMQRAYPAASSSYDYSVYGEKSSLVTRASYGEAVEMDLDGDGVAETVSADAFVEDGNRCIPELAISGKMFDHTYMQDGLSVYAYELTDFYYFLDLDTSDPYVEIAFVDYGPSNDTCTTVVRYKDGELIRLGLFSGAPEMEYVSIQGDGIIKAPKDASFFQTDRTVGVWKLTGEALEPQELTEGEFLAYRWRYGSDYPVTARRDFHAFSADPQSSAAVAVRQGTEVAIQGFQKTGDGSMVNIYFFFKDAQGEGQHACLKVEDPGYYIDFKVILPDGESTSEELFDGLWFFD